MKHFQKTDFGDAMEKSIAEGSAIISHGESVEKYLARVRAQRAAENQRKMYSFRLKVSVVEKIKQKAAAAGIPYQTYIGALLEKEAV